MAAKMTKPRFIAFEVTRRCRYVCRHCRAHAGFHENESELTTSQCKRILNSIAEFDKCTIILTGGEPMERSDIYSLIRYGKGAGLRMVMATCGYKIDDKSMAKLKEAGVEALSFSLDGATAATHDKFRGIDGAFDNVMAAAAIAKKHHVRFQINTTISKINIDEIDGIIELTREIGGGMFRRFYTRADRTRRTNRGRSPRPRPVRSAAQRTFASETGIEDAGPCYLRTAVFANLPTGGHEGPDSECPRLPRRQGIRVHQLPRRRADLRFSGSFRGQHRRQSL